jgi:hypothetical protein
MMTRLNRKTEIFDRLTKVELIREKTGTHGNTTLSAGVAAGASSLSVGAITNFSDLDYLIVDTGEFMEVNQVNGAPAMTTITLKTPLVYAHTISQQVKEADLIDLGHIEAGGIQFALGGQFIEINSAIRRLTLAYSAGYTSMSATLQLMGFNAENLALALGMPETAITGTGTVSDPWTLLMGADSLDTVVDQGIRLTGARKDGGMVQLDLWGVQFDFTALNFTLSRGAVTSIPVSCKVTSGGAFRQWN